MGSRSRAHVFDQTRDWVGRLGLPPAFGARHTALLDRAWAKIVPDAPSLPVDVPLAVAETLGLDPAATRGVASIGLLIWAGADLLDDLADAPDTVAGDPARQTLVAVNTLTVLPQLRLAGLGLSPARQADCATRLATGLLAMSAGQDADLDPHVAPTLDAWEAGARAKSGEQPALHAGLVARLVGASPEQTLAWESWGRTLGTLVQAWDDVRDVVTGGEDLANGLDTLPVILARQLIDGPYAASLEAALELASLGEDGPARDLLWQGGVIAAAQAFTALQHRRCVQALRPGGDDTALRRLIDPFTFPNPVPGEADHGEVRTQAPTG